MNKLMLNNKKYIVIEQRNFEKLQLLAGQKVQSKKVIIMNGKKLAYELIDAWAKEK